jgi:hypothetical protein
MSPLVYLLPKEVPYSSWSPPAAIGRASFI